MLKKEIIENMQNIVDNCMGDSEAACVATCPMHTDVKKYVRLIKEDDGKGAIKVIRENLFIPGTLGRICAHPCEKKCKWNEGKSPMAIASLKRYAADNFDDEKDWDLTIKAENGKKVAVIGAGPSGLQAALELRKEGMSVTVFEKLPVRGGMMAVGIPEYRLPRNILEKEISYLDKLGVNFKVGVEIGKDIKFSDLLKDFDSVVVAVGKHMGRVDRSLENFDASGVFSAAEYLKEAALTRNVQESGKKVLVVGGGDVAMDCCRVSRRLKNTEEVYSICLEDSFQSMASSEHEVTGAINEGIIFNHGEAIKEIKVDKDGRVSKVILKKCLSMFNKEGMFAPTFDENDTKELEVDTIVFAIGQGVDENFAEEILEQRRNSTFECNKETLQSISNEKVFIAGDASGESVIVIQAMATGRRAAESVIRFLNNESLTEGRNLEDTWSFDTKLDMPTNWDEIVRVREDMKELDPKNRVNSFDEVALGYTKEEALREADRCRQCECKLCMKECLMLREYTECPKNLFKEYLEKGYENMDKIIAYSCNQCSQCTIVCPKNFNIKDNFIEMKEEFAKENNGYAPLKELEYVAPQQEKEAGEKYSTQLKGAHGKAKKTKYVFVPGCTVPAYIPDACDKVLNHLKEKLGEENVGAILQCCGKVSLLVGEKERYLDINKKVIDQFDEMGAEVIVTICPSCYKVYSETVKNQKVISYWDLMREEIGLPKEAVSIGAESDVVFNIHDSCVTRDVISHHESVRWMLDEMNYKWSEIEHNGKNTRCCGVGGMACSSNPELYKKLYMRRANDFNEESVVTYCGSCRGTMEAAGKDAVHILDLMFKGSSYKASDRKDGRGYKNEEEMWSRRLATKAKFDAYKK
ncbi:FAD-dependent oxidoreductase [Eubacterium multiforme]|uniref:NADPH-dependent glutamate synthase beta subunit-like oxidoreductase n=1 Tax=Eubacterium multiforme TaxID=83339 RepID=A0ABT9UTD6_9FIRM|nr:FAD-dependent oxidoreductase [Eubacterium multiforme]MDQ0149575.1 NADPH-dependent glutamate synthase beta subunit-like oxidoreductase [Eubacterium multiforme]